MIKCGYCQGLFTECEFDECRQLVCVCGFEWHIQEHTAREAANEEFLAHTLDQHDRAE